MKIKIESEGTGRTTSVTNAKTGELIEGVQEVSWFVDVDGIARACLTIAQPLMGHLDIIGELNAVRIGGVLFREVKE